jgi:aspartate aminotransferase-like enzyme
VRDAPAGFPTKNALTFPVSGTGMAGMECVAVNLIEPVMK